MATPLHAAPPRHDFGLRGFATSCCWLAAALGAALLVALPLLTYVAGPSGTTAALVAAAICLATGIASLVLMHLPWSADAVLARTLLASAPRVAVPLLVCILVYRSGGVLVDGQLVYCLLSFYLVSLGVETWLAVRMLGTQHTMQEGT